MTHTILEIGPKGRAEFSPCGVYRYMLSRRFESSLFDSNLCLVNFIMLNPSAATQDEDDPTVRRCIGYAKRWGYSGLIVTNIFALRSTDPSALYKSSDPIGDGNDLAILHWAKECPLVVCAWGANGLLMGRGDFVKKMLRANCIHPKTLKMTIEGQPAHPLYLKGNLEPIEFK